MYPYRISPASTLCTHGAIVKMMQVMRSWRPCSATSTPQTEVRVRSRWPVATRRALSAYSVYLLILRYVWIAYVVDFPLQTLRT